VDKAFIVLKIEQTTNGQGFNSSKNRTNNVVKAFIVLKIEQTTCGQGFYSSKNRTKNM